MTEFLVYRPQTKLRKCHNLVFGIQYKYVYNIVILISNNRGACGHFARDNNTPEHQSRQMLGQPCVTADRSDLWRLSDNEKYPPCLIVTLSSLSTGRSWILAHCCYFLRIVIRAFSLLTRKFISHTS